MSSQATSGLLSEERTSRGLLRWSVLGVLVLASALNYLDRQLLAAIAPVLRGEFHLTNTQYGMLLSAFSITYMLMAPLAGLFIDRIGLNAGAAVAVAVWSVAGAATGFVQTLRGLATCRLTLGVAEAASIPCSSKASATYLEPKELGLGDALGAVGITVGATLAPILVAALVPHYGWRAVFVISGAAGIAWLPLWWFTSRHVPPRTRSKAKTAFRLDGMLGDRRFWGILIANAFIMTVYSLWSNWTTLFFVEQYHLTQAEANRYFAWIPAIFATAGGFAGGWLAFRTINSGAKVLPGRMRIARIVAPLLLVMMAVPLLRSPRASVLLIGVSFFLCMTILTNLHVLPIDLFGAERAGFTAASLTFSYALVQTIISPVIGATVDRFGFGAVCTVCSVLPLAGVYVLTRTFREQTSGIV